MVNVSLRGITLVTKFILVFTLARFLEPAELGLYGLVFAATTYALYAAGFDFYKFANRELITTGREGWFRLFRDQGVFYLLAYAVVVPLSLLMFVFGVLPVEFMPWFLVLLVLEHVAHELGRILVAMSEQLLATFVLFLRAGAWVLVLVPAMWFEPRLRTVEAVFAAWAIGAGLACLVGAQKLLRVGHGERLPPIDWHWLRRGVRVSMPFLVATLALKGLVTFDRMWLESLGGLEALAAYVLFVGIANVVRAFLDSGVFTFKYPALIRAAADGDDGRFRAVMRSMTRETVWVTLGVIIVSVLLINPLLAWIDRPVYREYLVLFYWTLGAVGLYAIGMVAHYGIYAYRRDGMIVVSQLAGLLTFGAAAAVLAPRLGATAVPMAVCVGYAVILVIKFATLRHVRAGAAAPGVRSRAGTIGETTGDLDAD